MHLCVLPLHKRRHSFPRRCSGIIHFPTARGFLSEEMMIFRPSYGSSKVLDVPTFDENGFDGPSRNFLAKFED